jgi:ATP synthase protein I
MNDELKPVPTNQNARFSTEVSKKVARKLRVQRDGTPGVWFGLGMFGLIGWSVALLVAGLVIGCANAWHWMSQEDKAMHDQTDDGDE